MISHEDQIRKVMSFLADLQRDQYYGKVTLDLQGGNILRIEQKRSLKLEDVNAKQASQSHGAPRKGSPKGSP